MTKQLEPLGAPARVRVTKVVRTSYRIEWEYDGTEGRWEDDSHSLEYHPVRRRQVRHMQVRQAAYRAAAMRLIFARRNRYSKEINDGKYQGCTLCDTHPVWSEGDGMGHTIQQACRYHSSEHVQLLRDRLARWLLWRDSRAVGS